MMTISKIIRYCLATLIFLSCCKNKEVSELELYFENASGKIDEEKLSAFKSSTIDSTGNALNIILEEIEWFYDEILENKQLNMLVDSFLRSNRLEPIIGEKKIYLGVAFHAYLNDRDVFGKNIVYQVKGVLDYRWRIESQHNKMENDRIISENKNRITIGDSIELIFPIHVSKGSEDTTKSAFLTAGYPYSYEYGVIADDSIILHVVLLEKGYAYNLVGGVDSSCFEFKAQVLWVSDTNVRDSKEVYKPGYQFSFCLENYGRIISRLTMR